MTITSQAATQATAHTIKKRLVEIGENNLLKVKLLSANGKVLPRLLSI